METESNLLFDLLVSWGPLIFLVIVWVAFMKKAGVSSNKKYMDNTTERLNEQVEEMKKMNNNLEKIHRILSQNIKVNE